MMSNNVCAHCKCDVLGPAVVTTAHIYHLACARTDSSETYLVTRSKHVKTSCRVFADHASAAEQAAHSLPDEAFDIIPGSDVVTHSCEQVEDDR